LINTITQDLADELQMPLLETSAKDGTNVERTFLTLAAMIRSKKIELDRHITL
jgi:Fe2+ transport system protein B